jgi:hypothetical protein
VTVILPDYDFSDAIQAHPRPFANALGSRERLEGAVLVLSLGISGPLTNLSGVPALEISLGRSQDLRVVDYRKDQRFRHRHQLLFLNIVL